jgi:hypothetical protein
MEWLYLSRLYFCFKLSSGLGKRLVPPVVVQGTGAWQGWNMQDVLVHYYQTTTTAASPCELDPLASHQSKTGLSVWAFV